ncbi:acyltransferase [Serratia liquefaciens]|jgi:acetyltransferase-like isoleucine patch superfamily enzyme|uniref:acyltransferase n=1 Tax=Serratia liquefaciens TaxID=614 RepID=UPI00061B79D7|nr:acyltransferase [Serratia liquefaciens]AKE11513.1 UDP-3-O-(3-hydroxymyristoyl) glucosamine N-acyltransferase [Serratia liquefaciens]MCH4194336.1 N-acetyltransferase [Serratia liquefaciens]MCH4233249.1 N-acetyltransferase [Serratia liquefaciens]MCH4261315.1 N-acetyltransferase [Serratia liquefaciens]MCI1212890.1 N-acetyltransferase [Serratia liquefaciens]
MSSAIKIRQVGIVDVDAGQNVTVVEPCNLYGCRLGDGVFVGPFVEIQKNVSIGARSKIQSHSFICEYVTIGEDCFIGHNVTFANDLFKGGAPNADPASWGRTRIGDCVSIGSGATVLAVEICSGVVIGAGAVVTKNITRKGIYAGNPARLLRELTP